MSVIFLRRLGWFCLLVLIQVPVLNQMHLLGYATPFLYVYLILVLPKNVFRNVQLLWGFFLGLAVDIFSNAPGMNAAATTFLAFVRPWLLTLFVPRDCAEDMEPGIRTMGIFPFVKYVLVAVLLHHLFLLMVESFSLSYTLSLLLKVVSSTLLSTFCIVAIDGIGEK